MTSLTTLVAGAVIYTTDVDRLAKFYTTALGFLVRERKSDYVALVSDGCELVLLRTEETADKSPATTDGPLPRRSHVAIKPVFFVPNLAAARAAADAVDGRINAAEHEWRFGAYKVCDGLDPDGNIIQLRAQLENSN